MDNNKVLDKINKKNKILFIIEYKEIFIYLALYFVANYLFLCNFPFMHSDESWLSGLSRNIIDTGSLSVTETFYDLYPRNPHAIKTVFHILQTVFILIFGYSLNTVRLMSLIFSLISLYLLYRIAYKLSGKKIISLLVVVLISLDIQYIYISHFARQEIVLVFFTLLAMLYYLECEPSFNIINSVYLGSILGISIGIHPNFLIIAIAVLLILFTKMLAGALSKRQFFVIVGTFLAFGVLFLIVSLNFNSNFIRDYSAYGKTLGVGDGISQRFVNFKNFYIKLYEGITGTYYLPNIKIQLISIPILFVLGIVYWIIARKISYGVLGIVGVNIGYFVIGRYGQPSIIFEIVFVYILLFEILNGMDFLKEGIAYTVQITVVAVACLGVGYFGITQILDNTNEDYQDYVSKISQYVPENKKVLANLNLEYYFDNGVLKDYRNLQYLKMSNISFEQYIDFNNIEYIIYPEEMDYIFRNSPNWDILYGNTTVFYEDMKSYLNENCDKIGEFQTPYAMRISQEMYKVPWNLTVYKVKE